MSEVSNYKCCAGCKFFNGLLHGYCKNKSGSPVRGDDHICENYEPKYTCKFCDFYHKEHGREACGADGSKTTAQSAFCEYFRKKPEYTIFHKIIASPEVLARSLCGNVRVGCFSGYYSMLTGNHYPSMEEAIAATVEKLKEVET